MTASRREAIAGLSVILGVPLFRFPLIDMFIRSNASDASAPRFGTIAAFQAGRVRGDWTSESVTTRALERCRTIGASLHAIDMLVSTALADARASDARARRRALRGPLDGAPVF